MKKGTYMALADLCGTSLLKATPERHSVAPDFLPEVSCAVYVAEDPSGTVCYIGSVCRPHDVDGLASHIREYLHDLPKAHKWDGLYVLPLRYSTPEPQVRRIAGDLTGWLLPYDRERWPTAS
ncbi:hypothetical protein ABT300_00445 [Streptomyces sp. NPDC001027]|uniref:hypothetical protein n=1 Tax=Streptomyces sp. NPDC001027 TaxID=3154771 RepID=UPI00332E0EF1